MYDGAFTFLKLICFQFELLCCFLCSLSISRMRLDFRLRMIFEQGFASSVFILIWDETIWHRPKTLSSMLLLQKQDMSQSWDIPIRLNEVTVSHYKYVKFKF